MNRKASLELAFDTLIKLSLYGLILVFIIFMSMKLAEPFFSSAEKNWRAQRNMHYLTERIEFVEENKLSGSPEASVILHLPENRMMLGFDADQDSIQTKRGTGFFARLGSEKTCDVSWSRPEKCEDGKACVCVVGLYHSGGWVSCVNVSLQILRCESYDYKTVSGTLEDAEYEILGIDKNVHFSNAGRLPSGSFNQFVLAGMHEPRAVRIKLENDDILLDPVCSDLDWDDDHSCKGDRQALPMTVSAGGREYERKFDCTLNGLGSLEMEYCHGQRYDVNQEYWGDDEWNGERVCFSCTVVGPMATSKLCKFTTDYEASVATGIPTDYCTEYDKRRIDQYGPAPLPKTTCDNPKYSDELFTKKSCNDIFMNSMMKAEDGSFAWGRDSEDQCGYCTLSVDPANDQSTVCEWKPWLLCDEFESPSLDILCDSDTLHPDLAAQCTDQSSVDCQEAQRNADGAKQVCPRMFDAKLPSKAMTIDTLGWFQETSGRRCVLCLAHREGEQTACAMEIVGDYLCESDTVDAPG